MRFILLYLFLVPVWVGGQTARDEAITVMKAWLDAQVSYDNLPGISVALVSDQEIVWSSGFGWSDRENEVVATPSTKYSICSISKLFTAIAIMQLYEQNKLRLDDHIDALLPWYDLKQQYDESGPITIRSLLTHSSGLPRESDHPYWSAPDFAFPTAEQVRTGLKNQETLYPASTYFQYSNLGMTLLGEVVEAVSGMDYADYVQEHILEPLDLQNTETYLPAAEWRNSLATGYGAEDRKGNRQMLDLFDARGITAAAGFSSTAEDLAKFAIWQFRLLESGKEEVLKPSTLKYMQQVHWMDPDWKTSWGLGFSIWESSGHSMVGHGGSCPGYRSTIMIDPSTKVAAIVMINAQAVNPAKYARGMISLFAKVKDKEPTPDSLQLQVYAGYYDSQPWWPEELLVPWQGKLASIPLPTENPAEDMTLIKKVEGDHFRRIRKDDELGEEIIFEKDEKGTVTRYYQHNNFYLRKTGLDP